MNKDRSILRWTDAEVIALRDLYANGATTAVLAGTLNMTTERVRARLRWESKSDQILAARVKRRAAQRFTTKLEQRSPREYADTVKAGPKILPEALRDRDERYAAAPRGITGLLCGDPPIGFSALERRT